MSENLPKSRHEVIKDRAQAFADKFRKAEMEIVGHAAMHGHLGSASLEGKVLEAAKRYYHDACVSVVRDMGESLEGLREMLEALETQFYRKPGSDAFGKRYDPGFREKLTRVRTKILDSLEHGFEVMSTDEQSSKTEIHQHQHGDNTVAVAAGPKSHVTVNVAYSHIAELIPEALKEASGYPVPDDKRHDIIDHIKSVDDENRKSLPDPSRLKRLGSKLANDLSAAKDAAVTAGGAALGTGAVEKLLDALSKLGGT